jgi:hypothetical protein
MTNDLIYEQFCTGNVSPDLLYKRGIIDIYEHLKTLQYYSSQCSHVTEMGTRFAISTIAFIMGRPKKFISIDLNYDFFKPYESGIRNLAEEKGVEFVFRNDDVLKIDIEETDCLFIDTLHTYEQLTKELNKHANKVKKWIILHDTVTFGFKNEEYYTNANISSELDKNAEKTGLFPAVLDFIEKNSQSWIIKQHFTKNNGLTVLERVC